MAVFAVFLALLIQIAIKKPVNNINFLIVHIDVIVKHSSAAPLFGSILDCVSLWISFVVARLRQISSRMPPPIHQEADKMVRWSAICQCAPIVVDTVSDSHGNSGLHDPDSCVLRMSHSSSADSALPVGESHSCPDSTQQLPSVHSSSTSLSGSLP